MQHKQIENTGDLRERVLAEFACIAFANYTDFLEAEEVPATDSGEPPVQQLRIKAGLNFDARLHPAIAELKQTDKGPVLKLHDKLAALDKLARLLGMSAEQKAEGRRADFSKLSTAELNTYYELCSRIFS